MRLEDNGVRATRMHKHRTKFGEQSTEMKRYAFLLSKNHMLSVCVCV